MRGIERASRGLSKQDVPYTLDNEGRFAAFEFVVAPRAYLVLDGIGARIRIIRHDLTQAVMRFQEGDDAV